MRRKFLILSLIIILITGMMSISVYAASGDDGSFSLTMSATNSSVTPGGEVLLTVKISNLNVGDDGVSQFTAYLNYDTDIFEQLTESSVDGTDGWKPSYNVGTNKVTLYRERALKTDGEIMQISLKTKSDVEVGAQGEIKISSIVLSDSVNQYSTSPISTTISITDDAGAGSVVNPSNETTNTQPIPINPTTNAVTPTEPENEIVEEPVVNEPVNEIEVVNEIVDSDMPYTGTDSSALIRIIIGVIFISLVMYIKIERMNKDIK